MNEMSPELLTILLVALAIAAILALLLLRRKQRVSLTDSAPVRPYMSNTRDSPKEGNDVLSSAAAGASDVTGEIIGARVHDQLGTGPGGDDLQRMKGVGPKLADALRAHGFTRFEQLAGLSAQEVERLDSDLGPFAGRVKRDRLVEQAHYLARGDDDGFEQNFGTL